MAYFSAFNELFFKHASKTLQIHLRLLSTRLFSISLQYFFRRLGRFEQLYSIYYKKTFHTACSLSAAFDAFPLRLPLKRI